MKNDDFNQRKAEIVAALIHWVVDSVPLDRRLEDPRLFNIEEHSRGAGRVHRGSTGELYKMTAEYLPIELAGTEFKRALEIIEYCSLATIMHDKTDFPVVSISTSLKLDKVREKRTLSNRGVPLLSERYPVFARLVGKALEVIIAETNELIRLIDIDEMAARADVKSVIDSSDLSDLLDRLDNAAVLKKVVVFRSNDIQLVREFVEKSQDIIRSSNIITERQKIEHLAHFRALIEICEQVKSVSVGVLKYLFVDRLKSASEGMVEDFYKDGIKIILMTSVAFAMSRI